MLVLARHRLLLRLVLAYIHGKPTEPVEHGGQVDHTLSIAQMRRPIGMAL